MDVQFERSSCKAIKSVLVLLTFLAAGVWPSAVSGETWHQVRGSHFVVISDGTEKQAREVALGFEQIHDLFSVVLPGLRTDSAAQTIVYAPKDRESMKALLPFDRIPPTVAGFFLHGKDTKYAVIRLDAIAQEHYAVYHEYIHELVSLNFTRMPTWLNEGLAEYYSNSRFEKGRTLVGAPSDRVILMQKRALIPIQTLLTTTPNFNDEKEVSMFYAESWALTHFLLSTDEMQNGRLMNAYLRLLQQGTNGVDAFRQTFGEPASLQNKFDIYVHQNTFRVLALDRVVNIDEGSFSSKQMSQAETDAMLGGFYGRLGQPDAARQKLKASLMDDPKLAVAYQNLALVDFSQGHDMDAKTEFGQALALDPNLYLSLYYQTMMDLDTKVDAASLTIAESALWKVQQLNSLYAPTWVELSKIYVRRGNFPPALQAATQAKNLEPDRSGYLTNIASIMLRQKDYANAAKIGETVSSLWGGSDGAEALAVVKEARRLGNISPTPDEASRETNEMKYADGTVALAGVIKSVACDKSKPLTLVLQSGDKDRTFQAAKRYSFGFSDTLWFAGDYFNVCYHLAGVHAVIRYKPAADAKSAASASPGSSTVLDPNSPQEFVWLELRDEMIPASIATSAN